MTLDESAQLMNDGQFRGRVKVAALKYADYILTLQGQANSRVRWAQSTMAAPDQTSQALVPGVVINVNVQQAGSSVTDENLAAAVQLVADRTM